LKTLPDPEEAFARRGAPFTFDSKLFLTFVKQLSSNVTLYGPSFDHKLKDPIENDIIITPEVSVVIVEGNYVSLDEPCWTEIANYVDDTWFIEAPKHMLRERIIERHLQAGISDSRQQAIERVENNDLINAKYIVEHSKPTNVRIVQASSD
jgi:pantothenate kinase